MSEPRSSRIVNVLLAIGISGAILSCLAQLSAHHRYFDLISSFRIQYVVLISVFLVLAVFRKKRWAMALLSVCLLVHVFEIVTSQIPRSSTIESEAQTIRLMTSNLLASNMDIRLQVEYIKSVDPDVIVFQEYTSSWDAALRGSLVELPYRITRTIDSPFGIAIFSKLRLEEARITHFGNPARPSVDATVSIAGQRLRLLGTHPPPPLSEGLYQERNIQMQNIAMMAEAYDAPLVVLGDFNMTPWSSHFDDFIQTSGLHDARRGFGVLPTWPSTFFPLQIPIDHVVASEEVSVVEMATSDGLGSDHRTLWVDVQLDPRR